MVADDVDAISDGKLIGRPTGDSDLAGGASDAGLSPSGATPGVSGFFFDDQRAIKQGRPRTASTTRATP